MARVVRTWLGRMLVAAAAAAVPACTISQQTPPPLAGPSEFALSLTLTASPEVLSVDGVSTATITIRARDENGNAVGNMSFRAEIVVSDGGAYRVFDCGALSARTVTAGADGIALLTYTAPSSSCGDLEPGGGSQLVYIQITPLGAAAEQNANNHLPRVLGIRLVPIGGFTPNAPNVSFTIDGEEADAVEVDPFTDVVLDASASTADLGASIVKYAWNFGDGTSSSAGARVTHEFAPGSHTVTLTVTDSNGAFAQLAKQVIAGAATKPTASFVYSPSEVTVGRSINFNGTPSTAATGRTIVAWEWDFGDGQAASGSLVSHTFTSTGTYSVVLIVRDDKNVTGQTTEEITVDAPDAPTATFEYSPTDATAPATLYFNAAASTAPTGRTISSYKWDFGDGSSGSGKDTSHAYAAAGTYQVILTITDSAGEVDTDTKAVTLK